MAEGNWSVIRVEKISAEGAQKTERHNERKNESYANLNVDTEQIARNVHFKDTGGLTYNEYFQRLIDEGKISTRGQKAGATIFNELVIDVNTRYFEEHGGYEYAKQFYEEAYRFGCEIYGEDNIVSAVMHADEINKAVSEELGKPVYHYHLHIVAIPTVRKEILWSKRCKDKSLVGTVKETIQQVSMSKKWDSKPALDEHGKPLLNANGKTVLRKSYSVLQDDFFAAMRTAGYDVERGERGSSEEHLTVTQFKVEREQKRLADLTEQTEQKAQEAAALGKKIDKIQKQKIAVQTVEQIEAKPVPLSSKVMLERSEYESLAAAAKKYITLERKESKLQKMLDAANKLIAELKAKVASLTKELSEYKSIRGKLNAAGLVQENEALRGKLRSYEADIERNNLWRFFGRNRAKAHTKDEAR